MTNYLLKPISELHTLLVNKEVTPLELTKECLERISKDKYNSIENTCEEHSLSLASEITDIKEDEYLKGIPYLAKDNYSTKGIETTASSNILNGYVPLYDATVISKLNKAGMIFCGHTTMDELAMGGTGTTGKKGPTLNPYDKARIIGGSSSGSASSVLSGIVPFALGSDTGDSVRKPASYSSLCGFKPTWGLISRFGLFPFAPSMDTVSYFTRNVKDAAYILTKLAGNDKNDMSSSTHKKEKYETYLTKEKSYNRIGYFKTVYDSITNETLKSKFKSLLDKLKKNGFEVIQYDYPVTLLNALYPTYMIISCCEATSNNANLDGIRFGPKPQGDCKTYQQYMTECRTKGFTSLIKRRFVIGSFALQEQNRYEMFDRAQKARRLIVNEMARFFDNIDYLISPASFSAPKKIDELETKWSDKPDFLDNILTLGNFGGFPSMTLPFIKIEGLPFGINVTGRCFEDGRVLSICNEIEKITNQKDITHGVAK